MKIIVILAGVTRGGIDFFQSLLDGHKQISQLPGKFYIDEFFDEIKYKKKPDQISTTFIEKYSEYFDSRLDNVENHSKLGVNRNEHYKVDKKKFSKKFLLLLNKKKINKRNIIVNLHLAYSYALGENISKKKIIILQPHHLFRIKSIINLDFDIIFTIRNPLASHSSFISNLSNFNEKILSPWKFNFHLKRNFTFYRDVLNLKKKIYIVKMEDLHRKNILVMKNFCHVFKIKYANSMQNSTFNKKIWWGDAVGKRYLKGVNKNFKNYIDEKNFFIKDFQTIEFILQELFIKYEYSFKYEKSPKKSWYRFLPFKYDYILLLNNIINFNLKNIFFIFYYIYKRKNFLKKEIIIKKHPINLSCI